MPHSSSWVSLEAPGISRSIMNVGIAGGPFGEVSYVTGETLRTPLLLAISRIAVFVRRYCRSSANGGVLQLRDRPADQTRHVHLRDAEPAADLSLRELLPEAQAQDLSL